MLLVENIANNTRRPLAVRLAVLIGLVALGLIVLAGWLLFALQVGGGLGSGPTRPPLHISGWAVVAALVILGGVTGTAAGLIHRLVDRPLKALIESAKAIVAGDYLTPVETTGRGAMKDLAEILDRVRVTIQAKTEALDESGRLFQTMFEQVPCYVSVQDRDFRLVAFNKMFENDFGHALGEPCYKAYKGLDSVCPDCAVERTFADGEVHSREEIVVNKDGSEIYFLNLTTPIRDSKGDIVAVMEMATDVTDLRRLENELKKSEEKYRLFFNNDPNPTLVFDRETYEILDANDRAAEVYGRPKDELIGMNVLDLTTEADRALVKSLIDDGRKFLERVQQVAADGRQFFVSLRAAYGEHLGRPVVIASTADITQRLETEQQLIQAAKMATLGEMSAGVAHEINQPLTVIGTGANYLLKQFKRGNGVDPETVLDVAGELVEQVARATRIINHLREFGRKAEVATDLIDINRPIENVFNLLGQQLRVHNIKVRTSLHPGLPPIKGDANRLEQVFVNLVLNARDAIEERREGYGAPKDGLISVKTFPKNGEVVVEISDNGVGIPEKQRDRIFEPFFTTKEVGKGTGLGLSISYGIVRDLGGGIEVDSEVGFGTTFTLTFPAAEDRATT